jgi:Na+-translocating ferredoxin:NAD+ oxidoreductase subunit G
MKTAFRSACLAMYAMLALPAHATDFTTPQALLSQRFHKSERVTYVKIKPDAAQRSKLEARLGKPLPKPEYTFFIATTQGKPDGYALFDDQLGQHEPISFATFLDPQGHVTGVEVVAYREPYGDGIRTERFRKQFVGRTARSQFRAGTDIDIIAGATISSRSMCVGVERAVALFEVALATR